ncbi:MAG: Gfo/Idh/MocA family oxidoreductase [Planctomycetes bacterium]|nr:Gfo/Idh/MocA family oxidoreductase [Planctomycetota bacterium]
MLKIAIIGCGRITEVMYLPEFASIPDVSVTALADTNTKNLNRLGNFYGIKGRYRDYREMLATEDVDAVCVCTPNYLHAKMTVESCRAGRHVLVEKPVATSIAEVKRMKAAAKEAGVFIMVEQTHRFVPANERAREVIRSGLLGKVIGFRARVGSGDPRNWSPAGKWFFKKEQAFGGALADIGIHIIDTVRWVSGKEIARVQAFTAKIAVKGTVEDNAALTVETTDGCVGTIEASWTQSPGYFGYQIFCEKGMLENVTGKGLRGVLSDPPGEMTFDVPTKSVHQSAFRYFADCVMKDEKPFVDINEGGRSLAVVIAAYRSAATGRVMAVKF